MLLEQLMHYEERMRAEGRARAEADDTGSSAGEMPFMYANQAVRWEVRLRGDGTVRDVQPHSSGKAKGKDLGAQMAAPNLIRTVGIKARLLMDNAEYVLGIPKKEGDKKAVLRHDEFKKMVRVCAETLNEPSVQAVANFLDGMTTELFQAQYLAAFPDFMPDTNVTFSVDGLFPMNLPAVQRFWAAQFAQEEGASLIAECLVTGEVGPVMDMEPVKIKGILGGQTSGMNFISANAGAFRSYGLEGSNTSPVKLEVAEKYANGLNRLLSDSATSLRVGGVTYAFWTREGDVPPIGQTLSQPSEVLKSKWGAQKKREKKARAEEVRAALWSAFTGQQTDLKPEAPFYTVGLTPSGSRIAVRTHLTSTVQDAVNHLADYFEAQSIAAVREEDEGKTYGVFQLVGAMYRDASKENIAADVDALVQHALSSRPLPQTFLVRLAGRNRADEYRVTRPRAALTKMVLLSRSWKEFDVTNANLEALDPTRPEAAYHLGRLLAVLDDIQSSVMKANTTLVDRFYGSMSTTPYAVVGRLMQGTQAHLQKLRKENEGAYVMKQRALEEVMNSLSDIPARPLGTPEQALFSLGYYHQRAAISAGYRERKAARDAAKAAQNDTQNEGESK